MVRSSVSGAVVGGTSRVVVRGEGFDVGRRRDGLVIYPTVGKLRAGIDEACCPVLVQQALPIAFRGGPGRQFR